MQYKTYLAAWLAALGAVDAHSASDKASSVTAVPTHSITDTTTPTLMPRGEPPESKVSLTKSQVPGRDIFRYNIVGWGWDPASFNSHVGQCSHHSHRKDSSYTKHGSGVFELSGEIKSNSPPSELARCFDTVVVASGGPADASKNLMSYSAHIGDMEARSLTDDDFDDNGKALTARQAYPPMAEVSIQQNLRHRHSKFFFSVLGISWDEGQFRSNLGHCFWARELEILRSPNGAFRLNGWGKFHGSPQELAQCFDTAIVECGGPPNASGALSGGGGTGVVGDMPGGDGTGVVGDMPGGGDDGEGEVFHELRLVSKTLQTRQAPTAQVQVTQMDTHRYSKFRFDVQASGWSADNMKSLLTECMRTRWVDVTPSPSGDSSFGVSGVLVSHAGLSEVNQCLDTAISTCGGPPNAASASNGGSSSALKPRDDKKLSIRAGTPTATISIGPVGKEKHHKYKFDIQALNWDAGKLRQPLEACIQTESCDITGFGKGDNTGWVLVEGVVKAEGREPLEHVLRCLDSAVLASGGPAHVTDLWTDRPTCTNTGDGMPGPPK